MTSRAAIRSDDPGALALRVAKHFAHKVPVESAGGVVRVQTRFGDFELEAADGVLRARATAEDEDALGRLEEVVASHVARFARGEPLEIAWQRGS